MLLGRQFEEEGGPIALDRRWFKFFHEVQFFIFINGIQFKLKIFAYVDKAKQGTSLTIST